jgi:ribosomal protein L11 methyltransferase
MVELRLLAPEALVEAASDALADELGALAVSVEDADAGTGTEQALFGEPGEPAPRAGWRHSSLSALFADEAAATAAATLLLAQPWAATLHLQALQPVPEQDWVRLTQAQFAPVAISPGFWIVPSWHEVPADARRVIRLDPGLAFGTGTHPTTRLCLQWIAAQADAWGAAPPRVLDYGCGSGILAIAAALHGAADVTAVDIDPAAVQATRANAQANGVALRAGLPDTAEGRYGVVLANILATPLKLLAPLLAERVRAGGWLVLAGILERQAAELRAAYAPWLELQVAAAAEGWILLAGRRVADPPPA